MLCIILSLLILTKDIDCVFTHPFSLLQHLSYENLQPQYTSIGYQVLFIATDCSCCSLVHTLQVSKSFLM